MLVAGCETLTCNRHPCIHGYVSAAADQSTKPPAIGCHQGQAMSYTTESAVAASRRVWTLRFEEAERTWSERLSAAVATASSKVEEFKQRQSLEAAKAAEAAALNAAEAESR